MLWKSAGAAIAALFLWAATAPAQEAKVFRLGDLTAFASEREDASDDDTQLVAYRGGYHGGHAHYGGYRAYGGYHAHYGHYHSHYGHYHSHYYRPYVNFNFGYGGYYRPYYYSYYRPSYYYYSPPVYYYYSAPYSYYCPIVQSVTPSNYEGGAGSLYPTKPIEPMRRADEFSVPPLPQEEEGTFPYNGGPANPVPMPRVDPLPQKAAPVDPTQGRVVSLPAPAPKYTYRAYGEKVTPTDSRTDRPVLVAADPAKTPKR